MNEISRQQTFSVQIDLQTVHTPNNLSARQVVEMVPVIVVVTADKDATREELRRAARGKLSIVLSRLCGGDPDRAT